MSLALTSSPRHKEAMHIFNAMNAELRDPAMAVSKILPRMVDTTEARSLMMQVNQFYPIPTGI